MEEKHLDNAQKCWNCGHNQFKIDADTASLVIYSVKRKWRDPNLWRIQISHFTCETDLISCRDWKLELSNRIAGIDFIRS